MRTHFLALLAAAALVTTATACGPGVAHVTFKKAPKSVSLSNHSDLHPKDWTMEVKSDAGNAVEEVCVTGATWTKYKAGDVFDFADKIDCQPK